ncbi:M55 family metallopeptidase [Lutispora sp.]|nr:M55 family metallopeptidase [Lutispora sp.]MEA4960537.1 M55 family metallopeptidase [Lutispora sp.]
MKIFISVDMEGIWGLVSSAHVDRDSKEYNRARKLMTQEANWAIEEAFNNGATEVVVNDSHGNMDNLIIEELDPRAQLISGSPKPLSMMEGINETFDGVIYVGYHSRAGTINGLFNHTYSGKTIANITVNGKKMGECGINSGVAGYWGVPILAIAGDDKLAAQAKEEIGDLETIIVKRAISRYCAHNLSQQAVRELYKAKFAEALKNIKLKPVIKYQGNITMDIEFNREVMAESAMLFPEALRLDEKTIRIESDDYLKLFMMFRACLNLGGSIS